MLVEFWRTSVIWCFVPEVIAGSAKTPEALDVAASVPSAERRRRCFASNDPKADIFSDTCVRQNSTRTFGKRNSLFSGTFCLKPSAAFVGLPFQLKVF